MLTENVSWRMEDVRAMCIEHDFYTCGDCEAYDHILKYVGTHSVNPTMDDLLYVARDIFDHSDFDDYDDYDVTDMMCTISNETMTRFYMYEVY